MKKLLVFLITLSVFAFLAVEMNFYSFVVLPTLSLSLCLAIFQRNRLMPNLISVHHVCFWFLFMVFIYRYIFWTHLTSSFISKSAKLWLYWF